MRKVSSGFTPLRPAVSGTSRGFTIIEILITTFIIGTVVVGLFGLFVLGLRMAQDSERRVVAVALANERMEMVRNLPYVEVGTVGGIPSGAIDPDEQIERNGLLYTVKTDIRYVDDAYDGQVVGTVEEEDKVTICHKPGTPDEKTLEVAQSALDAHLAHGDTTGACGSGGGEGTPPGDEYNADYKQVRVEVTWATQGSLKPALLITYVTPQGVEGGELGGTLDFQALNSLGEGVAGADVTLFNDTVSPVVDYSTQTNSEGRVVLPALPPASDSYKISVSKAGLTSEETRDETADFIPSADYAHLSMIVREVTSKTFLIDSIASAALHFVLDSDGSPVADVAYRMHGTKKIGEDAAQEPVFREDRQGTSDAGGEVLEENLVWDQYTFTIDGSNTGYDIKETSEILPWTVNPGDAKDITVTLVPHVAFSLHVTVVSGAGEPVNNATVRVYKDEISYDVSQDTGVPGQVFFGDIPSSQTYKVDVSAPGYQAVVGSEVLVEGSQRIRIELAGV